MGEQEEEGRPVLLDAEVAPPMAHVPDPAEEHTAKSWPLKRHSKLHPSTSGPGFVHVLKDAPDSAVYREDLGLFELRQSDQATYPGLSVAYRSQYLGAQVEGKANKFGRMATVSALKDPGDAKLPTVSDQ